MTARERRRAVLVNVTALAIVITACVFIGGALFRGVADAQADRLSSPVSLTPCATEDSAGPCYWDATNRGNAHGRSFVVGSDQVIYLLPEAR